MSLFLVRSARLAAARGLGMPRDQAAGPRPATRARNPPPRIRTFFLAGDGTRRNLVLAALVAFALAICPGFLSTVSAGDAPRHDHDATVRKVFDDPEYWAKKFEDPGRDAWQLPDSVIAVLATRDDLVVGDIGSATGYFPVRFARAVPRGAVIGADIEPTMVMYLNDRARREGLTNLTSVLAGPEDPHLPRRVDLAFLCNTYHHIDDRVAYFRLLRHQLRRDGRLAVVDFEPESEKGPPHKLAPEIVEEELTEAGYTLVARYGFLPEQYFLLFQAGSDP